MLDLALDLAKAVQQRCRDNGGDREIENCLTDIIKAERDGLDPAAGEITATLAELLDDESECLYQLCDKETREPLDNVPECFFGSPPGVDDQLDARGLCWIESATLERERKEREDAEKRERYAERQAARKSIGDEERAAVLEFVKQHGVQWKRHLRKAWEAATAGPLQWLASHPNFGEKWLVAYKLPKRR